MSKYYDTIERWLAGSELRYLTQGDMLAGLKFSGKADELFRYAQKHSQNYGFLPDLTDKIIDGSKTQARRLAQIGDRFVCSEGAWGVWQENGYCKCNIGELHSVGHKMGHTIFTSIRLDRLGNINEADAHSEGYASVQDYIDTWRKTYGEWTPNQEVWVVDFEYIGDDE